MSGSTCTCISTNQCVPCPSKLTTIYFVIIIDILAGLVVVSIDYCL